MSSPTNDDWFEVRAQRQPARTALIARFRCTPESSDAEWAHLRRVLADFDQETEEIYEKLIWQRYHGGVAS